MNGAVTLGATLYVPALNAHALSLARGSNPNLRSIIICLEDAIRNDEVVAALEAIAAILNGFRSEPPTIHVYVRPRDIRMLSQLLRLPGVQAVEGFVLPKVTTETLPMWLTTLSHTEHRFMPTIECAEAFDRAALGRLCDQLRAYTERVTAVRIGGNDILGIMGLRRSRFRTAYDGPLGDVIRDIARTFIPNGFAVSAPVFEHYSQMDVLRHEVEQDLEHGLLTKTAIHPAQVNVIQELYRPSEADLSEARAILAVDAPAVFGAGGSMCEPSTHIGWAGSILRRAQAFGVADQLPTFKVA